MLCYGRKPYKGIHSENNKERGDFPCSFAYLMFVGVYTCVAWWQTQDAEDVAVVGTKVCTTCVDVSVAKIRIEFFSC